MGEEDDKEDYGALIYRESQLRKAEEAAAAAAAKDAKKKENSSVDVSSTRRRASSNRASSVTARNKPVVNAALEKGRSKRKRQSSKGKEQAPRKFVRKQYRKKCSADGCTNIAQKAGVCIKHG